MGVKVGTIPGRYIYLPCQGGGVEIGTDLTGGSQAGWLRRFSFASCNLISDDSFREHVEFGMKIWGSKLPGVPFRLVRGFHRDVYSRFI